MSNLSKHKQCTDCKGLGWIKISTGQYTECIICNTKGITTHGSKSEAELTLLYKITLDYINGRQKGWYH